MWQEKARRKRGGKARVSPTKADHKEPSYAINPSPPADWYHRAPVSVSFPLSLLLSIAPTQRMTRTDRSIDKQSLSMLQMFHFFLFLKSMPVQQMESFWGMKHGEWGWLTGEWKEKKEQIPAAELNSISLDGAMPRATCWGGNGARADVGFTGRDDGPCVGAYRWGRGRWALLRVHCFIFVHVC